MSQKESVKLRAKIIGVLLRDARVAAGKSMKELGDVIGASGGKISSIERGVSSPSLPELELLAYYLETSIDHFWSAEIVSEERHPSENLEAEEVLEQRNKAIGALLRQARNENNLSQKDLAQRTRISASRIRRYENGETPVPLPELELLANALSYSVDAFSAKSGPLGDWIQRLQTIERFLKLPKALREFVAEPENQAYLEIARRLRSMPPEKLRALADALSELTH